MEECKWLPAFYPYPDWNDYANYEETLYTYFKINYLHVRRTFLDHNLQFRRYPNIDGKEESFYHFTCKNYFNVNDRQPDPDRIIRLPWVGAYLDHTQCIDNCCNDKPLFWKKLKNKYYRYYIYFRRYLVIIEKRPSYFLMISGFYVSKEYEHRDLIADAFKTENAIF